MRTDLAYTIEEIPLVDSHEHLLPEPELREKTDILVDLFSGYVTSDLRTAGATEAAIERLLDSSSGDVESRFADVQDAWEATKHTGHGKAVRIAASIVYEMEELTPRALQQAQPKVKGLRGPGERLRLLSETARLDHVQIDDHMNWPRDPELSRPDYFLHDITWWMFCSGQIEAEPLLALSGVDVQDLKDLREAFAAIFERFAPTAVAVKAQHAYNRTLAWEERSDVDAARALRVLLSGGEVNEGARLVLGDWCWSRGVELAMEHNLPFKLHTGYYAGNGRMPVDRIRAGNLCALLARYPEARFVLMHIAYPYSNELVAIAKHYPNVYVDLCWAWTLDPYSTGDFLRRFLHAVPANKLFAFGGDAWSPTQIVAYATQARKWLTRTLEAEVAAGDLTEQQAITVARRIMRDNQYACFDLESTRAAAQELIVQDPPVDNSVPSPNPMSASMASDV
jgi:predicted TIM-barrel fold metal-dependent hydrolase